MPSIHKLDEVEVGLYQFENKEEGERRAVIDRRQFSYSLYIPERRSGQERRKEIDLRKSNRSK
jgi:hypothetical protein